MTATNIDIHYMHNVYIHALCVNTCVHTYALCVYTCVHTYHTARTYDHHNHTNSHIPALLHVNGCQFTLCFLNTAWYRGNAWYRRWLLCRRCLLCRGWLLCRWWRGATTNHCLQCCLCVYRVYIEYACMYVYIEYACMYETCFLSYVFSMCILLHHQHLKHQHLKHQHLKHQHPQTCFLPALPNLALLQLLQLSLQGIHSAANDSHEIKPNLTRGVSFNTLTNQRTHLVQPIILLLLGCWGA